MKIQKFDVGIVEVLNSYLKEILNLKQCKQ